MGCTTDCECIRRYGHDLQEQCRSITNCIAAVVPVRRTACRLSGYARADRWVVRPVIVLSARAAR
jgi:hypothetical protein